MGGGFRRWLELDVERPDRNVGPSESHLSITWPLRGACLSIHLRPRPGCGVRPLRDGSSAPPALFGSSRQSCTGDRRAEAVATLPVTAGRGWGRALPRTGERRRLRDGISTYRGPSWRPDYPVGSSRDQSGGLAGGGRRPPRIGTVTIDRMAIRRRAVGRP